MSKKCHFLHITLHFSPLLKKRSLSLAFIGRVLLLNLSVKLANWGEGTKRYKEMDDYPNRIKVPHLQYFQTINA